MQFGLGGVVDVEALAAAAVGDGREIAIVVVFIGHAVAERVGDGGDARAPRAGLFVAFVFDGDRAAGCVLDQHRRLVLFEEGGALAVGLDDLEQIAGHPFEDIPGFVFGAQVGDIAGAVGRSDGLMVDVARLY